MFALMLGLLVESIRIAEKWSHILWTFAGSFIASLIIFFPGKREHSYNFESHLSLWPYFFLFFFIVISSIVYSGRTKVRLTEKTTLMQSMAIIYLVIDYDLLKIENWLMYTALGIGLVFCLFSFFNAVTYFRLSRSNRLWLSVWSSIIMLLLALDNILRIYSTEAIENTWQVSDALYIGLQYFLLGISAMYIARNAIMLISFLPGKGTFFNAQYFRDLREVKDEHIDRYDENQSYIGHSLILIIVTPIFYYINYNCQFVPAHLAVWMSFVLFPFAFMISRMQRRG